ncbi:MBL fold metallo-hydrolase [Tepidibacillus infernus]|uniref:MBL fold metallo-hydrolase n=1 Tax=Tepidibacillus infernus TaxID=1806172 RepID=UPI003B72B691
MTRSVVYIGHQSWLIDIDGTRILVDPVLTQSFGHNEKLRFEIFPNRLVYTDKMPKIDAIVITNEHLDHFHPPSLRMISKNIPIFMPELMPKVCIREANQIGYQVQLLRHGQKVNVKNTIIQLFQGSNIVPVWESRAASLYIESVHGNEGIFIQSDTIIDHAAAISCKPDIFIVTHNGQIPPNNNLGAWDNLLPIPSDQPIETTGIQLLQEILDQSYQLFPNAQWILFSGSGYQQKPKKHGRFLWSDYRELEYILNSLRISGPQTVGLLPGELADFSSELKRLSVDWINIINDYQENNVEWVTLQTISDLPAIFDQIVSSEQKNLIISEIERMTQLLLISSLGHYMISTNYFLDRPVGPHRFAIYLRNYHGIQRDAVLALNINKAKFEWVDLSLKEVLYQIPYGIDVNASDLCAVFEGRIHIWELATSRMRQWYLCPKFDSPVAFLYSLYSEQLRPDLAEKLYKNLSMVQVK